MGQTKKGMDKTLKKYKSNKRGADQPIVGSIF